MREETLVVGRVPFLVCAPFFHATLAGAEGVRFVDGVPSFLNAELRAGRIDCAPSSGIEYALGFPAYRLLPGISTSSRMEMKSVLFLSRVPWEGLREDAAVALSPDSATSNALFRILSARRFGARPKIVSVDAGEAAAAACAGRVFIGDRALRESLSGDWPHRYDLGGVWARWQGLPFSFGLWMVRREAEEKKRPALALFYRGLLQSLEAFRADPEKSLEPWTRAYPGGIPKDRMLGFYETADYGFSPEHARSLELFYRLAKEEGLLDVIPSLDYAAVDP